MDDERLDLWHNDEAKCPYCGFEDYDSWELGIDEDVEETTECPNCGEEYGVMRNVDITYTTWELKKGEALGGSDEQNTSY